MIVQYPREGFAVCYRVRVAGRVNLILIEPLIPFEVIERSNGEGIGTNYPKSGSYPAAVSRSDGSQGGSGRVILATT